LLAELNEKPKKVLKRIVEMGGDAREATVGRCVRLVKKSAHLESRAMIDILATDHPVSAELFAHYVGVVLRQCREHDLEQFMRLFTSNFFLTGESQQIARVLDTITQLYYKAQQSQQGKEG
jgi:Sec7-like guanine-nucleotide exchange factor